MSNSQIINDNYSNRKLFLNKINHENSFINNSHNTSLPQENSSHINTQIPSIPSFNIFNRNILSINSSKFDHLKSVKRQATLNELNAKENNYINPIYYYQKIDKEKNINKGNIINNTHWLNIIKNKIFSVDINSNIKKGKNISKEEFYNQKNNSINNNYQSINLSNNGIDHCYNNKTLSEQNIFNCKRYKIDNKNLSSNIINIKQYISKDNQINKDYWKSLRNQKIKKEENKKRLKPNYLYNNISKSISINNKKFVKPKISKISKDAPKWFKIVPDWKNELFKEEIAKKEDTIRVFSRFENWITVYPQDYDRRKALEKIKTYKKDVTSELMPKWMEIKYQNIKKNKKDVFKSMDYIKPLRQKVKVMRILMDKNNGDNNMKSIFSIGDFRHNVMTKNDAKYYGNKVSQKPKNFFNEEQ